MNGGDFLRCAVGDREFAIRAHHVCHVSRSDQLRATNTDDGQLGALTLGGQTVPVLSLRDALGLGGRHGEQPSEGHIAVTGNPGALTGWLVDRLARETLTTAVAVLPLPPCVGERSCQWFEGIVVVPDDDPLLLLNLGAVRSLEPPAQAEGAELTVFARSVPRSTTADPIALVFTTPALPAPGACRFAISGQQVAAIVHPSVLLRLPGCAAHVVGLTVWRDAVVPVFDFRQPANRTPDPRARRLIARCDSARRAGYIALEIDADVLLHRPAAEDRRLDEAECPPFATGMFDIDGDTVALLDLNALTAA
jgi:chemotaxis signal transduction protein